MTTQQPTFADDEVLDALLSTENMSEALTRLGVGFSDRDALRQFGEVVDRLTAAGRVSFTAEAPR